MSNRLYWIAINGSSCAAFPLAIRNPVLSPVPELLLGFATAKEASFAQELCLNAPIEIVKVKMREWSWRKDIVIIRPENPEPPTEGQTIWMETP